MTEEIRYGMDENIVSHKVTTDYPTASQRETTYTYDAWGNLLSERITANGQTSTTTYTYDYRNRLISTTDPLGNTATITYDAVVNRIAETSFDGITTTYTYGLRGRLIAQSTPVTSAVSAQKQYTYDNADRMIEEKQSRQADTGGKIIWLMTASAWGG